MKKILILLSFIFVLSGCQNNKEKYQHTFYDTFDTQIIYIEYANSEDEFNKNAEFVESEFTRLHKLYDNYATYEGVENVMSVNNNAGKKAVVVDEDLFNVIKFSIDNYEKTLGYTNIAMGSVLNIWHDIRETNSGVEESETILPNQAELEQAAEHIDINAIELNEDEKSIFISDPNVQIDLGAVAKGYATELVAKELEEKGVKHASINAGGNVRTIGTPGDGRETWGIALQNPDLDSSEYLEVLYIEGTASVVTSGDYQRYFMHDGKRYHHIVDPNTLWPEEKYRSVSIVTKDSGLADLLSTALFLANKEEAETIISNYDEEIKVLWATDEEKTNTPNMDSIMQSKGAESR